jgi:hypothetical protein
VLFCVDKGNDRTIKDPRYYARYTAGAAKQVEE